MKPYLLAGVSDVALHIAMPSHAPFEWREQYARFSPRWFRLPPTAATQEAKP